MRKHVSSDITLVVHETEPKQTGHSLASDEASIAILHVSSTPVQGERMPGRHRRSNSVSDAPMPSRASDLPVVPAAGHKRRLSLPGLQPPRPSRTVNMPAHRAMLMSRSIYFRKKWEYEIDLKPLCRSTFSPLPPAPESATLQSPDGEEMPGPASPALGQFSAVATVRAGTAPPTGSAEPTSPASPSQGRRRTASGPHRVHRLRTLVSAPDASNRPGQELALSPSMLTSPTPMSPPAPAEQTPPFSCLGRSLKRTESGIRPLQGPAREYVHEMSTRTREEVLLPEGVTIEAFEVVLDWWHCGLMQVCSRAVSVVSPIQVLTYLSAGG
jgi:hypothetical protein